MKKTLLTLIYLAGCSEIIKTDDNVLHAIVYNGDITDLSNSDFNVADEVDKFLNNDASSKLGILGTRHLSLYYNITGDLVPKVGLNPTLRLSEYSYIYHDDKDNKAKIHFGGVSFEGNTDPFKNYNYPSGTYTYKKTLINPISALNKNLKQMPLLFYGKQPDKDDDSHWSYTKSILYIKIKTSNAAADDGNDCTPLSGTLPFNADGYFADSTNNKDVFFAVYHDASE